MITYQEIMDRLKAVGDKVFYIPMTEVAVANLEQQVGIDFPEYYRDFLLHFGMHQDFVLGLFTNADDLIEQNKYLQESVPDYLMIGDNGGEDYWILRTVKVKSQRVFTWIDDEIAKTDFTFEDLLRHALEQVEQEDVVTLDNSEKSWCVQFAITTKDEEALYTALPLKLTSTWKLVEQSEAGVDEYVAQAVLDGEATEISRLTYDAWSTPTYAIHYKESLDSVKKQGKIKEWTAVLKAKFPEFNLVDYGILPTDFEMD